MPIDPFGIVVGEGRFGFLTVVERVHEPLGGLGHFLAGLFGVGAGQTASPITPKAAIATLGLTARIVDAPFVSIVSIRPRRGSRGETTARLSKPPFP